MVSIKRLVCFALAAVTAGCVAPEAPPGQRLTPSVATKPAISAASYEDAPLPNRKMGTPNADSVIKVAR